MAFSSASYSLAVRSTGAGSKHGLDTYGRGGPSPPDVRNSGSCSAPSAARSSSSCRHSWFFNLPPGRCHCSNSQTVRAISVTPRAENSAAVWRINSSSSVVNVRPQNVNDSGMEMEAVARSVRAGHNVQDHPLRRAQQQQYGPEGVLALLPASAQHAHQDLLRPCSFPGPAPTPELAPDHHATDG